jgi:hypothetical protein
MSSRFQVRLRNPVTGLLTAVLEDAGGFQSLSIGSSVNGVGEGVLTLDGEDSRVALFVLDAVVEVWRANFELALPWYKEAVGLHRTQTRQSTQQGKKSFTSYFALPNDFLARRIIAYKAKSAGAAKSGPADNVMKAFVRENLGSLATTGNGRLATATLAGLTVQADSSLGPQWVGSRAYRGLHQVLEEMAGTTSVDFTIVHTGGVTWEFRTYYPQLGADRRHYSLDAFGKNPAGNTPVVFDSATSTLQNAVYSYNRRGEGNAVFALGQGEDEDRQVREVQNAVAISASPWNRSEDSINASADNPTAAQLDAAAAGKLVERQATEKLGFQVMQQPTRFYGKHYFLGDRVTAIYEGMEVSKKITGIRLKVDAGVQDGEEISVEVEDVA